MSGWPRTDDNFRLLTDGAWGHGVDPWPEWDTKRPGVRRPPVTEWQEPESNEPRFVEDLSLPVEPPIQGRRWFIDQRPFWREWPPSNYVLGRKRRHNPDVDNLGHAEQRKDWQ